MSKQTINIGASPNDGTGTPLRTSFDYTNQNFTELYTALGGGVGLPGATTQVIFNDGGTNLAGDAGLVYNKTTDALTVAGLVTAGSATITGDLTVDTSTLKVDSTNNRVGIGTATPTAALDILGAFGTATAAAVIRNNSASSASNIAQVQFFAVNSFGGIEQVASMHGSNPNALGNNGGALVFSTSLNGTATTPAERYRIGNDGTATWSVAGTTAMTLDASGNLLVGTTSAGGSASNAAKIIGGFFSTVNGSTASTASGAAVTMFTSPAEATFMVSAYIFGTGAPASYNAVAIVKVSGSTAAITTVSSATGLTISLSGLNVQVTQTSGAAQVMVYSAIRIS